MIVLEHEGLVIPLQVIVGDEVVDLVALAGGGRVPCLGGKRKPTRVRGLEWRMAMFNMFPRNPYGRLEWAFRS